MQKISWMTPVMTLFDAARKVDVKANQELYDFLISNSVDGLVILGSAGEFFSLNLDEKKALILAANETIQKRVRFIVGT